MTLPLKESRAARDLARLLYDFLPGSGNKGWKGHVSFKTVAEKVGLGDFWQAGSKQPMIEALLERTLEYRRGRFEHLMLEIVRAGLTYREKGGNPVTPEEIEQINGLILEIGFKFPDLWDPDFMRSLRSNGVTRAAERIRRVEQQERLRESACNERDRELEGLKLEFFALHECADRQAAGRALERILNRLFALHGLEPREPFRVVGEQIDGSFELDHEVYLVEAKWCKEPVEPAELYVFREKILGKSTITRGVFLSINGYAAHAADALTRGKQPNFFLLNGYDLMMLLEDRFDLRTFLRKRIRLFAEGRVEVIFAELPK
jgi:hypothetical protein